MKHAIRDFQRGARCKGDMGAWVKMSSQGLGDVSCAQKSAELTGAGYAILESFADPMRLPKKVLEKARPAGNY